MTKTRFNTIARIICKLANNASNGIEPSFGQCYVRNVIREGKSTKEKVTVFSYELLLYRNLVNPDALASNSSGDIEEQNKLPDYFVTASDITPTEHVDIQSAD